MVLAVAFGIGIYTSALTLLARDFVPDRLSFVGAALIAMVAMGIWYRWFRLPFSAFLLGIYALAAIYGLTASIESVGGLGRGALAGLFDLRNSPQFALATLIFGCLAFAAGLWFDMRDPYRLGRHAATGFWLHLLAAPALVNTVALTLYNIGGTAGMAGHGAGAGRDRGAGAGDRPAVVPDGGHRLYRAADRLGGAGTGGGRSSATGWRSF